MSFFSRTNSTLAAAAYTQFCRGQSAYVSIVLFNTVDLDLNRGRFAKPSACIFHLLTGARWRQRSGDLQRCCRSIMTAGLRAPWPTHGCCSSRLHCMSLLLEWYIAPLRRLWPAASVRRFRASRPLRQGRGDGRRQRGSSPQTALQNRLLDTLNLCKPDPTCRQVPPNFRGCFRCSEAASCTAV